MNLSRVILLATAALLAQSASAQEQQKQPDKTAPAAADRNANAPAAPALDQEPHGSGSVYQELDELRKSDKSKEQSR
jgi:hypothetical protein